MATKLNKQHIQNMLDAAKINNHELVGSILQDADARLGKRIALAWNADGALYVKTDFMTYSEMNCYLRGYMSKGENRFKAR